MLRTCVLDFGESLGQYLILVEFAYNNSYHSIIQMAPYEAFYGRKYHSSIYWKEVGKRKFMYPITLPWIEDAYEKVKIIRSMTQAAQSQQKSYADNQKKDVEFEVGDRVFLKIIPLKSSIMTEKRKEETQAEVCGTV